MHTKLAYAAFCVLVFVVGVRTAPAQLSSRELIAPWTSDEDMSNDTPTATAPPSSVLPTAKPTESPANQPPEAVHKYSVPEDTGETLSPALKKDEAKRFAQQQKQQDWTKIRDGDPVPDEQFPECVAVGTRGNFDCSGVLIAEQLVLTAGHCCEERTPTHVLFGSDVQTGRLAKVKKAVRHELYKHDIDPSKYVQPLHDLTLLILIDKQAVSPVKLAGRGQLTKQSFRTIRVLGFGNTNQFGTIGKGIKRTGDVTVVSTDCAPNDNDLYGGTTGLEFVAKDTPDANGRVQDACGGDSGGPAYIVINKEAKELAGIVSRATKASRAAVSCGDGGVYERVPEALDWIRKVAHENGVKAP